MTYYFEICHIRIRCEIPFSVARTPETDPFMTQVQTPDVEVLFRPVSALTLPKGDHVQRGICRYIADKSGCMVYHIDNSEKPTHCVHLRWDDPGHILCEYLSDRARWLGTTRSILDVIGLETVMLQHNAFLLHAAFISADGQGIVFTAPSGTGKSTQAALWEKYRGADILNGDRVGLRKHKDGWRGYGLPYAGTSGIYRAESAPVRAIILLSQAKENRVYPVSGAQALRFMYPELTVHRWEPEFVDRALSLFNELCTDVPIYRLECTPDENAIRTLEKVLK